MGSQIPCKLLAPESKNSPGNKRVVRSIDINPPNIKGSNPTLIQRLSLENGVIDSFRHNNNMIEITVYSPDLKR